MKDDIVEELINVVETGEQWMNECNEECKVLPERFDEQTKAWKVCNFSSDVMKIKLTTKDMKIMEFTFSRDLFGQLLLFAVDQAIRMEVILFPSHPSTTFSLAHINAEMCVTSKATLVHKLEKNPVASVTDEVNLDFIVMDFLFVLGNIAKILPSTYSEIAKYIVIVVKTLGGAKVFLVCDVYNDEKPGIKVTIRDNLGSVETGSTCVYNIIGRQTRPPDIFKALKLHPFKTALSTF